MPSFIQHLWKEWQAWWHPPAPISPQPMVLAESCSDGLARFAAVIVPPPSACLKPDVALTWEKLSIDWRIRPVFSSDGVRHRAWVRVDPCDDLYGGGEVVGPLRRNGRTIALWNTDNFAYARDAGRRLYQSHPWMMGVRRDGSAYGVLFDTSWKAELSCNGGITMTVDGPAFAVWVIEGADPLAVLEKLAQLIGTMPMPPRWALGYHQCRWSYHPESEVRRIADEFRRRRIPCDVLWLDIDYMDGFRVFTVDRAGFPDPGKLNADLAEHGFHSVWMIDPGVKVDPTYPVYAEGRAAGHFLIRADGGEYHGKVWPGACAFPDFTSPAVRTWWADLTRDFALHIVPGLGGIWNDMNEPAVFDGPDQTMPEDLIHRGGGDLPSGPHRQYHNRYGDLMVAATRAGLAAAHPERRPFVLTRAGFLGSQRYAATWTGDNVASDDHLRLSVPMSLTLGLSGQPFSGPDVGGFAHDAVSALFARWFGIGALFPFCRGHGSKEANRKEPWVFGAEVEATVRRALERRYRLLPYFYTLAWQAHRRGLPIVRPVFMSDVRDPALRGEATAFMLGGDLLVVPRWAEHPALPHGMWAPLSLVAGDETDANQPDLRLRAGAILPVGPLIQHTGDAARGPLTLFVHLDADGEATGLLYDDPGDGPADGSGPYRLTVFRAHRSASGAVVVERAAVEGEWVPPVRDVIIYEVGAG